MRKQLALSMGAALAVMAGSASAALTVDTTGLVSDIAIAATAIGVVAAAIVAGPRLVRAAWGWIRGTVR